MHARKLWAALRYVKQKVLGVFDPRPSGGHAACLGVAIRPCATVSLTAEGHGSRPVTGNPMNGVVEAGGIEPPSASARHQDLRT